MNPSPLLDIDHLSVQFGATQVVHDLSLTIQAGEKLALVGESGSGKSVTALSVLRLHDKTRTRYASGDIRFCGDNLLEYSEAAMRQVRGKDIAMIFQEPMTSLNPVYPIGRQLIEPLLLHKNLSRRAAQQQMIELLDRTGIPEPQRRFHSYPHTLSGGQRQRVMIAMALACQPKLLIADEPTTALDVTIQLQILDLLDDIQRESGMAVLLITHDLNIVKRFAERVCVMQQGRVVEQNTVEALFNAPQQAYTRQLLDSQPGQHPHPALSSTHLPPLLKAQDIRCAFPVKGAWWRRTPADLIAVDQVSLQLQAGETLGIVGESGSGKTTLGHCLLRLQACSGQVDFAGHGLQDLDPQALRALRKDFQVVFQDPYSSLSPRMTVEDIIGEGLLIHYPALNRAQRREKVVAVLQEVDLQESMLSRYPHEFSGGQRQRIAIARAVILEPALMLLDEPTSALDVSVQKQVLALLSRLQQHHGMSYLFISHDLKVIRSMAHRIIVMRHGQFIEAGDTETLFTQAQQPYTQSLLQASLF